MNRVFAGILSVLFAIGISEAGGLPQCPSPGHGNKGSCGASASSMSVVNSWTQQSMHASFSATLGGQTVNVGAPSVQVGGQSVQGVGNPSIVMEDKPDFLTLPALQAAPPMDYRGPYEKTAIASVMPWFDRGKWVPADFVDGQASGRVRCSGPDAKEPSGYFYIHDARGADPKAAIRSNWGRVTRCICQSADPTDDPISVWDACGPALLKKGARHVNVVGSTVTHWVAWESDNKGGSAGGSSIFGLIFGLTAQGGVNVAKGSSGPIDKLVLVVEGFYEIVNK
jgi:hypothetical protein